MRKFYFRIQLPYSCVACSMKSAPAVQMLVPVISLAFLIVIASTAIYTPLLLYLFDLRKVGWLWEHGALFSAMISSTDAVAVAAILKKGGGRKHVRKLEGACIIGIITTACNCLLLKFIMHSMR